MRFGERLRRRRKELGMRQEDVAEVVGVSQPTITKWENGVTPDTTSFAALAAFLEATEAEVRSWVYGLDDDELAGRVSHLEAQMALVRGQLEEILGMLRDGPSPPAPAP